MSPKLIILSTLYEVQKTNDNRESHDYRVTLVDISKLNLLCSKMVLMADTNIKGRLHIGSSDYLLEPHTV